MIGVGRYFGGKPWIPSAVALLVMVSVLALCMGLIKNYSEMTLQLSAKLTQIDHIKVEHNQMEFIMRELRRMDASVTDKLMGLPLSELTEEALVDKFYETVTYTHQGVCRTVKRFGGVWMPDFKALDGDKFICMDRILKANGSCLIYSFGINNEWSFEDTVDQLNCKVYSYDHTIDAASQRGKNINFFKLGIGSQREGSVDSLQNIIKTNGHQNDVIDFLKIDVEGAELGIMDQWIENGVMDQVDQIGMELHTETLHFPPKFKWLFETFQKLYKKGFRLISYFPNTPHGKMSYAENYYAYMELVLKKDVEWSYLDKQ